MQVEMKIAVPCGHQINAPGRVRLSVDLDAQGHRLAPISLEPGGLIGSHENIGIDSVDLDPRSKAQHHPARSGVAVSRYNQAAIIPRTTIRIPSRTIEAMMNFLFMFSPF